MTVGPENPIRVERDDTAELFCEVDSKPKVHEVRWVRDGRFVQTNFRHLIPRANLKDAGPYICSADNGLGQVILSSNYNFYPWEIWQGNEFPVLKLQLYSEDYISLSCLTFIKSMVIIASSINVKTDKDLLRFHWVRACQMNGRKFEYWIIDLIRSKISFFSMVNLNYIMIFTGWKGWSQAWCIIWSRSYCSCSKRSRTRSRSNCKLWGFC